MTIKQNGPRELHAEEVAYPPATGGSQELENYFAEESFVGTHFLFEVFSDISLGSAFPSRPKASLERNSQEDVIDQFGLSHPYDNSEIWAFSPEGFEGDILDVVFSDSFQNLRGKGQHGPITHFLNRFGVSRFEHSIDALFTLRALAEKSNVKVGDDLQFYTAIHDIGHGAGSHWSEMVVGRDYEIHERRAKKVLEMEGLWDRIEEKYGYIFERRYDLVDASKPDLSIDRLSYILKDAWRLKGTEGTYPSDLTSNLPGEGPEEDSFIWGDIREILDSTEIHEETTDSGQIKELVMTDEEVARKLSETYLELERRVYFNPGYDAFNRAMADAARIALHSSKVSEQELFSLPDRELFNKIAKDSDAREHLDKVFEHFLYSNDLERSDQDPDITVEVRRDIVDPKIREYESQALSEMQRASDYFEELEKTLEKHNIQDGRKIGFEVDNWEYPDVKPYCFQSEQSVVVPEIERITSPGLIGEKGYWSEKKKEYRRKSRESVAGSSFTPVMRE